MAIIDVKEIIQAGISGIRYLHEWRHPDDDVWAQYEKLQARFPVGAKQTQTLDINAEWATSAKREATTTGHDQ